MLFRSVIALNVRWISQWQVTMELIKWFTHIAICAYGGGHYLGCSRSFGTAVNMAYGQMGFVTDSNQHIVWDRINRGPIRNIKSPVEEARKMTKYLDSFDGSRMYEEGLILIDAGGCSLSQVLYYIDKGIPDRKSVV